MAKMGLDYSKLTDEQRDKLEAYELSKKQVDTLKDLADMTQEVVNVLDAMQNSGVKNSKDFGAVLVDIREKLSSLDSKEAPEMPDTSKDVVDSIKKLEKALTASIKGIEVNPNVSVPKIDAPDVNVPEIDLKGVEDVIRKDIPKAFEKAVKAFPKPKDIKMLDYSEKFDEMVEWLKSIDTSSRMKPAGVNAKISNFSDLTVQTDALTDTELRATPVPVSESSPSTIVSFVQTIDTAGAAEQLETNTCVAGVLQAPSTNTGVVYIGGSGVSSSDFGAELQPGQATGIAIDNTNKLYADVATSGDKIAFLGS